MNDWDACISEDRAARMSAAHIDSQLRKVGIYSHLIQFINVDGRPRQIKCHARHVDETVERLRAYDSVDKPLNIRVTVL